MKILIGSKAIKYWFLDFPREPKDTDYACDTEQVSGHQYNVENLYNPIICKHIGDTSLKIASPYVLYTLKMSHMFWDINWSKHMFDIQFLKGKGCILDKELFYNLYDFWNEYHGKNKRSDLKMTAEDFFDNAVECEHSHDYLHTLIKPIPTYTKILIGEVEVGEEKFNVLSREEKLDLVREEVMVMAYERYPHMSYKLAYARMLKKFIINHAPLWEAIFIIENYIELHKPNFNYYKTINDGLKTN